MSLHIYRVTVRGSFADLTDEARARIEAEYEQHDYLHARFTPEGTFVYDVGMGAFSFRYELREYDAHDDAPGGGSDNPKEAVMARALAMATAFLDDAGFGFRRLRASATDMADMWTSDE
jgi:hypothetical protein